MSDFTTNQKAIAIAPKFTALASVFGSAFIIYDIAHNKTRMTCSVHRLLLGMSVCDLLSSSWFFLTSWPIPEGTPGVYGAIGNQATCTAQGFFSQASLATAIYNASLSVFYVLQIRMGWRKDRIARSAEPLLHGVSIGIGLGTSFAGIGLKLYNNDMWECWISPYPLDCKESWKYGSEGNCIRGDNASLYRWVFYYAILWTAIVVVTVCMVSVYRFVLHQEKASEKYGSHSHERKFSKKVATQGYWYCGAFYATWFFPTVTRLIQVISGKTPFWLICLTAMFVPIQGLLNFVVYMRPRYKKHRRIRRCVQWVKRGFKHSQGANNPGANFSTVHTGIHGNVHSNTNCSCWNESKYQTPSSPPEVDQVSPCPSSDVQGGKLDNEGDGLKEDSERIRCGSESSVHPTIERRCSIRLSNAVDIIKYDDVISANNHSPDAVETMEEKTEVEPVYQGRKSTNRTSTNSTVSGYGWDDNDNGESVSVLLMRKVFTLPPQR